MQKQNTRVILASEYPEVRHFLKEVAEEGGAIIVGQAQDASKALTLAKNLRPDVALIDCYLPHAVGLDAIPLSRMGGLDTAQTISEEIPNTKVILLNNLDTEVLTGGGSSSDVSVIFSMDEMGVDTPYALETLYDKVVPPNALVFANVETKPKASHWWNISSLSSVEVVFGGLSILCGFGLVWTLAALTGTMLLLAYPVAAIVGLGIGLLIKRAKRFRVNR